MMITSSSFSIHTFLNIASAATGIISTINVLHVCIYLYVMHMYIYGFICIDLC